jgi:hypothetical protein
MTQNSGMDKTLRRLEEDDLLADIEKIEQEIASLDPKTSANQLIILSAKLAEKQQRLKQLS